jgi:hypothetical protein
MDIEEIVRRAQKEGRFEDLPGKGKPLNLAQKQTENPIAALAKEAGFVPEWARLGKELDESVETINRLKQQWFNRRSAWLQEAKTLLGRKDLAGARQTLRNMERERENVLDDLALRWTRDRRTIQRHNLLVPLAYQQRAVPSPQKQLLAFTEESPEMGVSSDGVEIVPLPGQSSLGRLLEEAEAKVLEEEGGSRPGMNVERAAAVIGFTSKAKRIR